MAGVAVVSGCGVGRGRSLPVIGSCRWQWGCRRLWVVSVVGSGAEPWGVVVGDGGG